MRVAVMISGGGSNLQSLIDAQKNANYEISLVISDRENVFGLERAKENNIANFHITKNNFIYKDERNEEILRLFSEYEIDIVVLAGYLSIFDEVLIKKYTNKIINIHPSLIPSFCGMGFYGHHVHDAVYKSGVKITGATVHFVNVGVDTGEIILQETVKIENDDNPDTIANKVLAIEHKILPKALELLCNGKIEIKNNRTYISE